MLRISKTKPEFFPECLEEVEIGIGKKKDRPVGRALAWHFVQIFIKQNKLAKHSCKCLKIMVIFEI